MTHKQSTACDGPNCGKDITEGDGVRWRLIAQGEQIPLRMNSSIKAYVSASPHQHHFCTFTCLSAWAAAAQVKMDTAQADFEASARARQVAGNNA